MIKIKIKIKIKKGEKRENKKKRVNKKKEQVIQPPSFHKGKLPVAKCQNIGVTKHKYIKPKHQIKPKDHG